MTEWLTATVRRADFIGSMSAKGLGRVKTAIGCWRGGSGVSGRDRCNQLPDSDDVHDPGQIIGQDRKCHFGGNFWKRFRQEVCSSHARLHRAERMLDCLPTLAHRFGVCIKALLHRVEQMLVLPAWNAPLRARRALGFERTILTSRSPVAPYQFAVLLAGKAI